jgi:hypothetical protein
MQQADRQVQLQMARPTVFFDITLGGSADGRIVMKVCFESTFGGVMMVSSFGYCLLCFERIGCRPFC